MARSRWGGTFGSRARPWGGSSGSVRTPPPVKPTAAARERTGRPVVPGGDAAVIASGLLPRCRSCGIDGPSPSPAAGSTSRCRRCYATSGPRARSAPARGRHLRRSGRSTWRRGPAWCVWSLQHRGGEPRARAVARVAGRRRRRGGAQRAAQRRPAGEAGPSSSATAAPTWPPWSNAPGGPIQLRNRGTCGSFVAAACG